METCQLSISKAQSGEVAEWSNVRDWKSGVPRGTVGSNPTLLRQVFKAPETQGPFSFKVPHGAGFHAVMAVSAIRTLVDFAEGSALFSTSTIGS